MIVNKFIKIYKVSKKAFGQYKWQILLLGALSFISGLMEGIGINGLIPLFSFITGDGEGGTDIISRAIKKLFLTVHVPFTLKYLLLFIILLFFLRSITTIIFQYFNIKIVADYEERTRSQLFAKTLNASWPYLLKQKLGHLESVLMTDVQIGKSVLLAIVSFTMIILNLVIYIFIALNISVPITIFTLFVGGMLFFIIKPLMRLSRIVGKETSGAIKDVSHFINQGILGLKTIKSMMVNDQIAAIGQEHFIKLKALSIRSFLLSNISGSAIQFISVVFVCAVFAFSYKRAGFNFAALIAIIYLVQRLFDYIKTLQLNFQKSSEVVPYLLNVLDYQDKAAKFAEEDSGRLPFEFNNELNFSDVSFSYESGKEILSGINFTVKRGEMVGLIGPSGAGKTTIVDLILRLFNPTGGEIRIDNNDVKEITISSWRKNIGYVSQDIFLMNDTITNNIRFYDESISDEQITESARDANIYEFIQGLPDKFSTVIGERGILLSAGQRQRLIIARILARKPKLLVFDEATSALDNESELKIQKVIENLKGKTTVIVIAHRLSTIMNVNNLLVIEKGKIIEQGAPSSLLSDKQSYFYKVYNIRE